MSSTSNNSHDDFGPIKKLIWPIHNYELKKFLPLAFIMFGILFNYTLLRDTKDALVTNATGGSNVLSFLKLYCVTPAAILFVIIYSKLTTALKNEQVFYVIVTPFLIFFGLFAFVIGPNADLLHPSKELVASWHGQFPRLSGFIDIIAYWSYSLFYVLSEIWGSAMLALMFWQFANQVVRMNESKRFYGLFVVISNVALICSGQVVKFCSQPALVQKLYAEADWDFSMKLMMSAVVLMGLLTMAIYRWMHTSVLVDPRYYDAAVATPKKKKQKPGLIESAKIIFSSPELGLIALLIMAYGVTINLIEVQWKNQLVTHFAGNKGAYNGFMGDFSSWTGVMTIIFSLFIGSNVLRKFSWFISAVITPTVTLIGGVMFFLFIMSNRLDFLKEIMVKGLADLGTNPIAAAAFLGAGIVILAKSIKYSLFDPTKEMAYIPLNEEVKTKGKAAVDVIGGRAGKAGGGLVQSTLAMIFKVKGDVAVIAPYAFVVFALVCVGWIMSVKLLSKKVLAAIDRSKDEGATLGE
jgi:AAA family ATP:ADP antiporter